jgi:hypothetical protein
MHWMLYPREKNPSYPLDRRMGGLRTGLYNMERRKILPLLGLELQPLGHPAFGQSLY